MNNNSNILFICHLKLQCRTKNKSSGNNSNDLIKMRKKVK